MASMISLDFSLSRVMLVELRTFLPLASGAARLPVTLGELLGVLGDILGEVLGDDLGEVLF